MKKRYKLPIQGAVLAREPLTGDDSNPVCIIPIDELPNYPTRFDEEAQKEVTEGHSCTCLDYNIDEEWCEVELEASESFHNWLAGMLPKLKDIQRAKGWKLDKSKMVGKLEKK